MSQAGNRDLSRSQRWMTFALALLVLLQAPGILPLLFAGAAWIDGEHRVELDNRARGFQLVLKHDPKASPGSFHSYTHQHCPISQVLVAFSAVPCGVQQDHVIAFASTDTAPAAGKKELIQHQTSLSQTVVSPYVAALHTGRKPLSPVASRPPPSIAAASFVHQTVLLI